MMNNLDLAFDSIVSRFIKNDRPKNNDYKLYIKGLKSLTAAITVASSCNLPSGKRHSHQYRIPSLALIQTRDKLLLSDFQKINNFEQLHEMVRKEISEVYGIGPLTIYDISHRISIFLNIEPEHIYLHCGTKDGAKALGLNVNASRLNKNKLPKSFQQLDADEIESCLCVYKKDLWRLRNN
jgi:hypothetical protein